MRSPWPPRRPVALADDGYLAVTAPELATAILKQSADKAAAVAARLRLTPADMAGNFPGRTQTMPLAVYLALEQDLDSAIVLSLLLLVVSVGILAALRGKWGAA